MVELSIIIYAYTCLYYFGVCKHKRNRKTGEFYTYMRPCIRAHQLPPTTSPDIWTTLAFSPTNVYNHTMTDTNTDLVPIGSIPPPSLDDLHRTIIVLFARGYTVRAVHRKLTSLAASANTTPTTPTTPGGFVAGENVDCGVGNLGGLRPPRPVQVPTIQTLLQMSVEHGLEIEEMRREIARRVLNIGLARKEERIMRLTELAESLEDSSGGSPKSTALYLHTLEAIRKETENIGIRTEIPETDDWRMLLTKLAESRTSS